METQNNNLFEKVSYWLKSSISLKAFTILILSLLLLIPQSMIKSLIREREMLRQDAVAEVSEMWSDPQKVTGPLLTVPFYSEYTKDEKVRLRREFVHFLPEDLLITGQVETSELERGIFEVPVYETQLKISGAFGPLDLRLVPALEDAHSIDWDNAFLTLGITDQRGMEEGIKVNWEGVSMPVYPGSKLNDLKSGITSPLDLQDTPKGNFTVNIAFKGSKSLSFIPSGKESTVNLTSNWPHPSFTGNYLPADRDISENGFKATWKVNEFNRNYPQAWIGNDYFMNMMGSYFGTDMYIPVDDYQKSMRSAKYALLTIVLTFLVYFLFEIFTKKKIHIIQYILVGLALVLYYALLVALSEHISFQVSYVSSSLAIITIVTLYTLGFMQKLKYALLMTGTLVTLYSFLFVLINAIDYALLMGTIGLMVILSAIMFSTRKINWYQLSATPG